MKCNKNNATTGKMSYITVALVDYETIPSISTKQSITSHLAEHYKGDHIT
jgi:hypothetical protein